MFARFLGAAFDLNQLRNYDTKHMIDLRRSSSTHSIAHPCVCVCVRARVRVCVCAFVWASVESTTVVGFEELHLAVRLPHEATL